MVGDVKLSDLEAKKKALIAEAEVYRQTLKLELQNVRLSAVKVRRTVSSFSFSNPLLVLGATLAGSLLKRKGSFRLRAATIGFIAWQIYQRVFVPLRGVFPRRRSRARQRSASRSRERLSVEEI